MKQYVLLGSSNPNPSMRRLQTIHASDSYDELSTIWETIETFYRHLGEIFEDGISEKASEMITRHPYLKELYNVHLESVIWTVDIIGIFETKKLNKRHETIFA